MKIEDTIKKTSALGVGTRQNAATSKGVEKAEAGAVSSVNVSLSSELQALTGTTANNSVFDSNKVEQIKAAIAEGRFQVDAEKVAEGLMDTVKDLIQRPKVS